MIDPTVEYAARADGENQTTVCVLRLAVSGDFSTEDVDGLSTSTYIDQRPGGATSQTNPLSGASDIGKMTLRLRDQEGAVTELRRQAAIVGQEAEVWQGYRGLPFFDSNGDPNYLLILTGKVTGFKVSAQGLSYDLEVSDRFDQADFPVLAESAIGAEPGATSGDKSFDSGSLVLSDTDDDDVYDTVTLTGNPVDIALKMLLSGGGNGGGYDVWPVWAGAGLTIDEVDVAWCEAERAKILTVDMRFVLKGQQSAKAFVEEEVCKALGGYTLLSGLGKIRVHFPSSPISTADLALIDDTTLVSKPLPADSSDFHITHITFQLGDAGDGPTILLRRASPQYLAGDYPGVERRHEIASRGLQPDLGGVSVADAVMDMLFARYGVPPPRVRLTTMFKEHHLVEAGDVVRLSSRFWTDWDGRGVEAERLLETLSVRPNVDRVEFDVIDLTGALTAGTRAIISPNGQADWTAADATEKQFAYIADAATGEFSDGESAMIWG